MNIPSALRRSLLRTIYISATDNSQTLSEAVTSLMTAKVTDIQKGSGNKILTSTSRSGQSVTYSLPVSNISSEDLSAFYGMILDNLDYIAAEEPTITTDAARLTYLLASADFNGYSSFSRIRYNA